MWLVLQVVALSLAAFRVPLAAQYPQPAEFQAIRLMLAVQFGTLAVMHPWLLRNWATAIAILASAWVMLSMAALLSAWAILDSLPVSIFLTLWIVDFALLARIRLARSRLVVTGLASAYVIGGPLLWYLGLEFASASSRAPTIAFGPLFFALSTPRHIVPSAWMDAIAVGLVAAVLGKLTLKIPQNNI